MGWWGVAVAIILPWLAGALCLRAFWSTPAPGRWPLALGYGYLFGMVLVTLLLRLHGALAGSLGLAVPATLLTLSALTAGVLILRVSRAEDGGPRARAVDEHDPSRWQAIALVAILLWLALRFIVLAMEVWWQPLFPWDAWTTWGLRARVWAELGDLVPFVSPDDWLANPGAPWYPIDAWRYPPTVSLLAAWPALAFGAWNETAANLPWLGCAAALALAFYGQARIWGASALAASFFVWLLISLPLLGTHIALAGYADLWLATALGLAVISSLQWARTGDARQAVLAIACAIICLLLKLEGAVWAVLLIPAWIAARLPRIWLLAALAGVVGVGLMAWAFGGIELDLPGLGKLGFGPEGIALPVLGELPFAEHGTWQPVLTHLFVYDNWHLLAYVSVIALGWGAATSLRKDAQGWQRFGLVWVLASLLAYYILFFWTEAHLWAVQGTSLNRVFMHFVPGLVFWAMTLWLAARPSLLGPSARSTTSPT